MSERKFNWKRTLFIASLAMNVLVVAALTGAAFRYNGSDRPHKGASLQGAMIRALPLDQRKLLGETMRGKSGQFKKQRGESHAVKVALKSAISAVPFDADALRDVFERQKQVRSSFSDRGDALWIELITQMSDEQRVQFANDIAFSKPRKARK